MTGDNVFLELDDVRDGHKVSVRSSEIVTIERYHKGHSVLTLRSGRQVYFPRGRRALTKFIVKMEAK